MRLTIQCLGRRQPRSCCLKTTQRRFSLRATMLVFPRCFPWFVSPSSRFSIFVDLSGNPEIISRVLCQGSSSASVWCVRSDRCAGSISFCDCCVWDGACYVNVGTFCRAFLQLACAYRASIRLRLLFGQFQYVFGGYLQLWRQWEPCLHIASSMY